MKLKTFILAGLIFLGTHQAAMALETIDGDNLWDNISYSLDLDFKQEDAIKPIVMSYASSLNNLLSSTNDEKTIAPQINQLNEQLESQFSQILSSQQMDLWKTDQRSLLPYVSKLERGESGERNEGNENEAAEGGR